MVTPQHGYPHKYKPVGQSQILFEPLIYENKYTNWCKNNAKKHYYHHIAVVIWCYAMFKLIVRRLNRMLVEYCNFLTLGPRCKRNRFCRKKIDFQSITFGRIWELQKIYFKEYLNIIYSSYHIVQRFYRFQIIDSLSTFKRYFRTTALFRICHRINRYRCHKNIACWIIGFIFYRSRDERKSPNLIVRHCWGETRIKINEAIFHG